MFQVKHLLLGSFIFLGAIYPCWAANLEINVAQSKQFNNSQWQSGFTLLQKKGRPLADSRFSVSCDGVNLRIRFEAFESALDKLVVISKPLPDPPTWRGDAVEISICNDPTLGKFYKFCIAPNGAYYDTLMEDNNTGTQTYVVRDNFTSTVKAIPRKIAKGWGLDITIPLGDLGIADKAQWRLNVARMRSAVKREISSYCPIDKLNMPIKFAKLKMPFVNNKQFLVNAKTSDFEVSRTNQGNYKVTFQRSLLNQTGKFAVFESSLVLRNTKTNAIVGSNSYRTALDNGKNERFTQEIKFAQGGNYSLESVVFNGRGNLLKREITKLNLQWQPVTTQIVKPVYRQNIYATMPDKKIEVKVTSAKVVKFSAAFYNSKNKVVSTVKQYTTPATITLDTSKLPNDTYYLRLNGKYNNSNFNQELQFKKLPFSPGEIWFDKEQIMYIEGKAFFPIMVYGAEGKLSKGINSWQRMDHFKDFSMAKNFFKENLALGRYTLNTPWQEFNSQYSHLRWKVFKTPRILDEPNSQQAKMMTNYVKNMIHTPGILGWYLSDEPEGPGDNPLWYEGAYKLLSQTDPYHPTVICNWSPEWAAKYYKGCDVLFPDCYIHYFEDNSTERPRSKTANFVNTISKLRPTWLFVQLSGHPLRSKDGKLRGRVPTLDELRHQVYQAIINNAKGIGFYKHTYASMYEIGGQYGVDTLALELRKLTNEILLHTIVGVVKVKSVPHEATLSVVLKPRLLISSNPSNKKLKVTYTFNKVLTFYEAGTAKVFSGKSFTDELLPFETRLYCQNKALATSLVSIAKQRALLQKAIANRKVAGNLIGQGEIYECDQRDWSNGKLSKNVPKLSASSDKRIWETRDYGSLYFLIDGQRYTNSHFTSWMPETRDKAPWVEVKLNKQAKLGRVELFTQGSKHGANLVAGRLLVKKNNQWLPIAQFKDNKKLHITVKFPQVVTDTLRLEVTKMVKLPNSNSLNNRLLTEIEWYEK